jgi:hypothetical protein
MFQTLDKKDPQLSVLRIINTRWLSLSNAVSNLHQIIFSIIDALDDDAINNTSSKTRQRAQRLHEDIDIEFILATKFLADILFTFSNLVKIFQSDYVALSDVHIQLNAAIDSITTEFIGNGDDPDDIDYVLPTYGNHLRTYMSDLIEPDVLPTAFKEFAIALVNNLHLRFPDTGIYNAMKIFDFSQVPAKSNAMAIYGENEIKILGDFYGNSKYQNGQAFPAKVNKNRVIQEWREAKLLLKNYQEFSFIDGWRRIFTSSQFLTLYPNLSKVVNYSLIVPLSNGNVERIFSQQNLIKTKVRNQMKLKTKFSSYDCYEWA